MFFDIPTDNQTIRLNIAQVNNYIIDWNDGEKDTMTGLQVGDTFAGDVIESATDKFYAFHFNSHTYGDAGKYKVDYISNDGYLYSNSHSIWGNEGGISEKYLEEGHVSGTSAKRSTEFGSKYLKRIDISGYIHDFVFRNDIATEDNIDSVKELHFKTCYRLFSGDVSTTRNRFAGLPIESIYIHDTVKVTTTASRLGMIFNGVPTSAIYYVPNNLLTEYQNDSEWTSFVTSRGTQIMGFNEEQHHFMHPELDSE